MGLQCGIVGIANTGKTTLFNCISNTRAESTRYAFSSGKSNMGMVSVPDQRLPELTRLEPSERVVPATVEIVDIPGLTRGSSTGEGLGNKFLADIRNTDALIHVLRCFDDDTLPHVDGSVDPVRDMETVDLELIVKDLESVERKLERYEKAAKSGDKTARRGLEVLGRLKEQLEAFNPARNLCHTPEEQKFVDELFLLSVKPVLYVCNVDEGSLFTANRHVIRVKEALEGKPHELLVLAAGLESDIAELDNPAERQEFLAAAGLDEPGVNKLIRSAYHLLDLQTFFTVGPKEIRAWTFHRGMTAPQAAGVIHSDMERGFIRAEVIKYDDFIRYGSESACREAGKLHVEGRNYVVCDGDILHIRFNV